MEIHRVAQVSGLEPNRDVLLKPTEAFPIPAQTLHRGIGGGETKF